MPNIRRWSWVNVVGNLFDVLSTLYFVTRWGIENEGNPFMRWLMQHNLWWFIIFKIVVGNVMIVALYYKAQTSILIARLMVLLGVGWIALGIWNTANIGAMWFILSRN